MPNASADSSWAHTAPSNRVTKLAGAVQIVTTKRFITPVSFHRDVTLKRPLEFSLRHLLDHSDDTYYWQAYCYALQGVVGYGATEEDALTLFFDALLRTYRDLQLEYSVVERSESILRLEQAERLDRKLTRLYRQVRFAPRVLDF